MKCLNFVILFFLCLSVYAIAEESRIFMDCYINGQSVKLAFDTGAEGPILFRQAAKRLKLSVKEPPGDISVEPGEVKLALTEKCQLQLAEGAAESPITFAVVDIPDYMNFECDGLIGWGGIKNLMVQLDPLSKSLKVQEVIKFDKSKWKCLDIRTDLNILVIKGSNENTTRDSLLIDTGFSGGLTVRKELWQQLTGDETLQSTTLTAIYSPSVGLTVNKEKWIHEVNFSDLKLRDIPVQTGMEAYTAMMKKDIDVIMGMWGLSCYSWIVDGPSGKIYFRENDLKRIPEMYDYNRLGAVFVPEDIQTTNALIAHVIKDSPAYTAGIRDGDELLRIGQLDVTKWRTDPEVMPLSRFWDMPAGTEMDLQFMRDSKVTEITVTLEEIFKK